MESDQQQDGAVPTDGDAVGGAAENDTTKHETIHIDEALKNFEAENGDPDKLSKTQKADNESDDPTEGIGGIVPTDGCDGEEDASNTIGEDEGKADEKGGDGDKKDPKSITRIRYSNDFKVKMLDELEVSNATVAEMARRHKLPEATLRDWVKTKDKIITAQVNRRGSAKSNSRDNLQKVTDALRTFMDLNDRLGACGMSKLPITNAMIAKQGQEIKSLLLEKDAKKPFLTEQERKTLNAFNASIWWSKKWARKHNLHSVGHREAAKAAAALSSQVPEIRNTYSKNHIFFVVDTMLFYKVLPTRSFVVQNAAGDSATGIPEKAKYIDVLKDRLSLFICANSSGTKKIPLAMVSDSKKPPSFVAQRQKVFPYMHQANAWADPKSLLSWWKDVFLPNIRAWTDEKVLLVLQKPSIVDLDDPQGQVSVKFLPTLLANNHNSTGDGLSVSSFFEPPINMLSIVKTKYRYELLKEVFQIFEERQQRREVAEKANLAQPGLKQGHLPHLQDSMRILNDVWTNLPANAIASKEEDGGEKKKRRKRRKKKGTSEDDIIENEAMAFTDELGTDELIKDIVHFFRKNIDDVRSVPTDDSNINSLDKAVAEVERCFLNEKLLLQSDEELLRKILGNWIGLEDCQDIRAMLQEEILAGMKFRLIIGVDDVDDEEDQPRSAGPGATVTCGGPREAADESVNEEVAIECATQLLKCAVRLSKENSFFHDLASQLIEASDAAFVAMREAKMPPELRKKLEPPPPKKKRKPRVVTKPRKKRAKLGEFAEKDTLECDSAAANDQGGPKAVMEDASALEIAKAVQDSIEKVTVDGDDNVGLGNPTIEPDYNGAVFEI